MIPEYRRELTAVLHRLTALVGDYHQAMGHIAAVLSLVLPQVIPVHPGLSPLPSALTVLTNRAFCGTFQDQVLRILFRLYDPQYLSGYFTDQVTLKSDRTFDRF